MDPFTPRLRERYWGAKLCVSYEQVAFVLVYDWTLTDAERRRIMAWWTGGPPSPPVVAECALRGRRAARFFPCNRHETGQHYSTTCGQCGACVACRALNHDEDDARSYVPECGCCVECYSSCDTCGECTACGECECNACENCDRRVRDSLCGRCNECERCCDCARCSNCGDPCEYVCDHSDDDPEHGHEHGYCEDCCANDVTSTGSHAISASGATHPAHAFADRTRFRSSRLAGVEVEYTRASTFRPIARWANEWGAAVHRDGSCGWECVTAPAAGNHLLDQIHELTHALEQAGARTDHRCGVHVHVDARDLHWPEVARLTRLWARIEGACFLLAGQERTGNQYCTPWRKAFVDSLWAKPDDPKGAILDVLLSDYSDPKEYLASTYKGGNAPPKKANHRYHALNLAPWLARWRVKRDYGRNAQVKHLAKDCTVEFRLHGASLDAHKLTHWTMLMVRIVDWVARSSDADVDALPKSSMRALMAIAPECKGWLLARLKAYRAEYPTAKRTIGYYPELGYTATRVRGVYGEWWRRQPELPTVTIPGVYIALRSTPLEYSALLEEGA